MARRAGNSIGVLGALRDVDVFLHDSLHTYDYETRELTAVEPNLHADAVILSDNAHESSALSDWAERSGRHYLFFKEQPLDHWWRGDGIGAAWADRRQGQYSDRGTGIGARPSSVELVRGDSGVD